MKFKKTINNLTFSNLYISFAAGIICSGLSHFLNYDHVFEIGLFVFSSTLSVYSFQRLVKYKLEEKRESELNTWLEKTQVIQISYIFLSAFLSVYLYFFVLNAFENTKWWMFFSIILSVLYAVKIKGKSLRDVPYLKMHLIAIVWCKALVFPILLNNDYGAENGFFILIHYFFFIALCIPFDIRDLNYDHANLRTLPQIVGVKISKLISCVSFLFFMGGSIALWPNLIENYYYLVSIIIGLIILSITNEKRKSFFFALLIDGIIILIGLSYFFTSFH
jgi:hypothetical protein